MYVWWGSSVVSYVGYRQVGLQVGRQVGIQVCRQVYYSCRHSTRQRQNKTRHLPLPPRPTSVIAVIAHRWSSCGRIYRLWAYLPTYCGRIVGVGYTQTYLLYVPMHVECVCVYICTVLEYYQTLCMYGVLSIYVCIYIHSSLRYSSGWYMQVDMQSRSRSGRGRYILRYGAVKPNAQVQYILMYVPVNIPIFEYKYACQARRQHAYMHSSIL